MSTRRPIEPAEVGNFGIDDDNRLYWKDKIVQTESVVVLSAKQSFWAFLVAIVTIVGVLTAIGQTIYTDMKAGASSVTLNLGVGGKNYIQSPAFTRIADPIGPFEPDQEDCLESGGHSAGVASCAGKDEAARNNQFCESKTVQGVVSNLKGKDLTFLLVVGSADKLEPSRAIRRIYGSNEGLAQARANQVLRCLQRYVSVANAITSIRGPEIHGAHKSSKDTIGDRSVEVFGAWSEGQNAQ